MKFLIAAMFLILPLYTRISAVPGVNLGRYSKDQLFVLFSIVIIAFQKSVQSVAVELFLIPLFLILILINQYEPASSSVSGGLIYLFAGIAYTVKLSTARFRINDLEMIETAICWAIMFQIFLCTMESIGVPVIENFYSIFNSSVKNAAIATQASSFYGTLGNPNTLGAFIGMTFPVWLKRKNYILILVAAAGLLATRSQMGMGAAVIGSLAYYNHEKIKRFSGTILISLVAGYFAFIYFNPLGISSAADRWEILKAIASKMTLTNFIIGTGAGWLYDMRLSVGGTIILQEHNELFAAMRIFGMAGAVYFIYLCHVAIKGARNRLWAAIFMASFVNCLGNFTLHASVTAIIFMTSMAICLAGKDELHY